MPSKIKRLLRRCTNSVLNRFGLSIVKSPPVEPLSHPPSDSERIAVDEIVTRFTSGRTGSVGDLQQWKSYLSNRRLSFFADIAERFVALETDLNGKRIADFGCGSGYLLRLLNRFEPNVNLYGFDTFEEGNVLARMFCPNATITNGELGSNEEPFDLINCLHRSS